MDSPSGRRPTPATDHGAATHHAAMPGRTIGPWVAYRMAIPACSFTGHRQLVIEPRPSPAQPAVAIEAASTPADDLPGLYRDILDRVAELEGIGERAQAGRIRMAATQAYSDAWDEPGRGRLLVLIGRADRVLSGHDRPRGWTLRRRSAAAR
jgi:hypothetical protein